MRGRQKAPRSRWRSNEEGAAAVEFAVVWILLATFVIAIIQFGIVFNNWLQLSHAAREGARWASLRHPDSETRTRVQAAAQLPLDPGDITIVPSNPGEPQQGQQVVVTVSYRVPVLGPIGDEVLGGPGTGTIVITASAAQMVE